MTNATGEAKSGPLRLGFDSSVQLLFRGSAISSDGGLLLHRELDDALGLTDLATDLLVDHRTGKNGRHTFVGLLRQSVFSRLAGYEDVNNADSMRGIRVYDLANLQAVCWRCHSGAILSEEVKGYDSTIGQDGWPVSPNHPSVK